VVLPVLTFGGVEYDTGLDLDAVVDLDTVDLDTVAVAVAVAEVEADPAAAAKGTFAESLFPVVEPETDDLTSLLAAFLEVAFTALPLLSAAV